MEIKKKLFIVLFFVFLIISCTNKVSAINFEIEISGKNTLEVNETIKLTAYGVVYNDVYIPEEQDGGIGKISSEDITNEVKWTSSNSKIAKVENGEVTAKSSGTVIIKAEHDNFGTATFKIDVLETTIITTPVITPEYPSPEDDGLNEISEIPGTEIDPENFYYETEKIENLDGDFNKEVNINSIYFYMICINIIVFIVVIITIIIIINKKNKTN